MDDNRVVKQFAELKEAGKKALVPFLTAGYPDLETTAAFLSGIEARGVRICELGIPFSDPVADGPTIQASYTATLDHHIKVDDILAMVAGYREQGGAMALLAMVTYSIVYRKDVEKFCQNAKDAGLDGLIVPDIPIEESVALRQAAEKAGLCLVELISPTTPQERRIKIARKATGFVYFMSVAGITGERRELPESTFEAVSELKQYTDNPICIGFGISDPQMVQHASEAGDGAIVGSAIIHKINDGIANGIGSDQLVENVCNFCEELLAPIR